MIRPPTCPGNRNRFLDAIVQESYREIRDRWINRLAGVDVFGESHAETMMIYVRWDDKL